MTIYVIRRIGQSGLFILTAWLLIYTGIGIAMPNSPGANYNSYIDGYKEMVQQSGEAYAKAHYYIDPEVTAFTQRYKFDKPWPLSFFLWLFDPSDTTQVDINFQTVPKGIDVNILGVHLKGSGILTGDFGKSDQVFKNRDIGEGISTRWGNTVVLVGLSLLISILFALPIGIIAAARHRTGTDHALTFLALTGYAIPPFSLATMLIVLLAIVPYQLHTQQGWTWLPYLPPGTVAEGGTEGSFADHLYHLVLPVTALSLPQIAWLSRHIRFSMLEVLQLDYIRTAWAKGLSARRVIVKHAFRNALIPFITAIGLAVPLLAAGSIIVETVFSYSGMGQIYFRALGGCLATPETAEALCKGATFGLLQPLDYPLTIVLTMMLVVIVAVSNMLADIAYAVADPRISYRRG